MLTLYATTSPKNLDLPKSVGMLSTEREFQRVHIPIRIKTRIPERGFFLLFFKKKKKAGGVSNFFVFGDTSHLFNLYLYYNGA